MTIFGKEPAVIIALIGGAIIAAVQVLGPELFPEVEPIIIQAIQAVVAIVAVLFQRANVYSPATYDKDVSTALHTPPPTE